ncbi:MAG: transposase [Desulfovibrio sp.]|nr:transposase [Desulfovibrio sp.]
MSRAHDTEIGNEDIGKTPLVEIESKKMKVNMLSAVSKRGKLRFVLYKDNMNAEKLIDFMRRLVKDTKQKVFLILDNLRVHHSKKVRSWLEKHKAEIEVFYLQYAPARRSERKEHAPAGFAVRRLGLRTGCVKKITSPENVSIIY